ncbi:hypothetical protein HD806DRAFT_496940 [Xylariaceae sp. AK1471]|nr:hypothetical protein HD806DRAFT_496940 [Xylariaceae sp. AK1471]
MDQRLPTTCLSAEPHDDNIKDHLLHFLGCIPIHERHSFLDDDGHPFFVSEVAHNVNLGRNLQEAQELSKTKRLAWSSECRKQLRRIDFLREKIAQDKEKKHLVERLLESGTEWKQSRKPQAHTGSSGEDQIASQPPYYAPISDAATRRFELEKDVKASLMQFEQSGPRNDDGYGMKGSFHNQKISIMDLFDDKLGAENPLCKGRFLNRTNYFHIPYNNMIWAEEALARYFNRPKLDPLASKRMKERQGKSELDTILNETHWASQLQEGRGLQSRFMRPLCRAVSSDRTSDYDENKNVVLFMPYIHWETSKNQKLLAKVCKDIDFDQIRFPKEQDKRARMSRRSERSRAMNAMSSSDDRDQAESIHRLQGLGYDWEHLFGRRWDTNKRILANNRLAQYLIDAARLFKAISLYTDTEIHRKFLTAHHPLHPRRTLDQAHYWSLANTQGRDQDQVVFRATTAQPYGWHNHIPYLPRWTDYHSYAQDDICDTCTSNIRKVSRVLMVDQLWMWILDAKTVVTCFPARYGANNFDCSDIYKAIEARCGEDNSVRSAFDLALIIFEECSCAMLSRRAVSDERPEIVKAFSEAIADITRKQAQMSRRIWRSMDSAQRDRVTRPTLELLSVQHEFTLEMEVKDIREELRMLLTITENQTQVLQQLIDVARRILIFPKTAGVSNSQIGERRAAQRSQTRPLPGEGTTNARSQHDEPSAVGRVEKNVEACQRFQKKADEILASLKDHVQQLQELDRNAEDAETKLKDLSELKQRHLGVVQAWQSAITNDHGLKQGRSVFIFTIVTIIFLPLSFLSSVFGMNSAEFSEDNTMTLREQFTYIFSISAGVVVVAVICSLSETVQSMVLWIHAIWLYVYNITITTFLVRTGLYGFYSSHFEGISSQRVYETGAYLTQRMKFKARQAEHDKRRQKRSQDQAKKSQTTEGKDDLERG